VQEMIASIVHELVSKPDAVKISQVAGDADLVVYSISVDPSDMGRLIGKGGATAHALRTLVRAMARTRNQRVYIEVASSDGRKEVI